MTVTSVKEVWQGRDADTDGEVRTYTRLFRVLTNNKFDEGFTVGSSPLLPALGSLYPQDSFAWCQKLSPRQESFSPFVWMVTASYSSQVEVSENPLNDPADIEWGGDQFQRPAVKDRDGNGIVNSAGEFFDPPLMMDDSRNFVSVKKKLAVVPTWILNYKDAINSDSFEVDGITVAQGLAKMQRVHVSSRIGERNGIQYRTVSMNIHLRREGWSLTALDQGFYRKDPSDSTKRIPCVNDDGSRATTPKLLDGNGAQLANPSLSNAVFIERDVYDELPFSSLPLS